MSRTTTCLSLRSKGAMMRIVDRLVACSTDEVRKREYLFMKVSAAAARKQRRRSRSREWREEEKERGSASLEKVRGACQSTEK